MAFTFLKKTDNQTENENDEKKMKERYVDEAPAGEHWPVVDRLLKEPHFLVAGTTGSGKSVFLNSFMYNMLEQGPDEHRFVFVDLKKVELLQYKYMPHTLAYTISADEALFRIDKVVDVMTKRYEEMAKHGWKEYPGCHIWVIIDELADIMQGNRTGAVFLFTKITRLGRAARIHLVAATQNPLRDEVDGIPACIAQNITCAVALRCRSEVESMNVIGAPGAEKLPRYGEGILWDSKGMERIQIPLTPDDVIADRVMYWRKKYPKQY